MEERFNNKVATIMRTTTQDGVLGRMDAILRLNEHYGAKLIKTALIGAANGITNATARDIALDAYLRRVR